MNTKKVEREKIPIKTWRGKCGHLGQAVKTGSYDYCPECGEKWVQDDSLSVLACSKCGEITMDTYKYCSKCGEKFE